jgi:hypothetical protein
MAHVITHREFKLLLDAANFPTKHSVIGFNDTVADIASSLRVRFDQFDSVDSQIRQVRFFDTADEALRKNNVILRIRQDQSTGWPDETWEVTLKRRSHDYQVASDFDVGHSLQPRGRFKFKEEIVRDEGLGTSRRIFSNNNVFASPLHTFSAPVSRIVEIFPGLAALNLDPAATIEAVNKARVFEVQARLGILNFGKDAAAHLDLAVWMRPASDAFNILIAELAFAYKVAGTSERHQEGHDAADRFFVDIQKPLGEKLASGTTKTALIYGTDER